MRRICIILGCSITFAAAACGQNLLDDPSLELATGSSLDSNSSWVATAENQAGQFQSAGWASNPRGSTTEGSLGFWFRSFVGSADQPVDAELYQDVAAGPGEYSFGAFVYHEFNFMSESAGIEAIAYSGGVGGTVTGMATIDIDSIPTGPVSAGGTVDDFVESLSSLTAGAGTDTIRIRAFMQDGIDAGANPQSFLVDDFSLVVVPEPAAAPMVFFIGLGICGLRRRLLLGAHSG